MKISIATIVMFLGMSSFLAANGPATTGPTMSYLKAKQRAEVNEMKYVLYFKADWCMPCQWMEETTFQDETVKAAIDNLFILVPLDIDAFEGYALKEYFQVQTLPTMLVINEHHEIVNRNEGSISPSKLLDLVATDRPQDKMVKLRSDNMVNSGPELLMNNEPPRVVEEISPTPVQSEELPSEIMESLTKFSVQLGAFSSYENAKLIQDQANSYTTEAIEIMTIPNGEGFIYKVFAGRLNLESEAHQLKRTLSSYGLDGFVKSIVLSSKS